MSRWVVAGRGPEPGRVVYSREIGPLFVAIDGGDRGATWEINISEHGQSLKRVLCRGSRGFAQRRATELGDKIFSVRVRAARAAAIKRNPLLEAISDSLDAVALVRTRADRVRVARKLTERLRRMFPQQLR